MAQMTIRCTDKEHERYREAAYLARVSLNSWVVGCLLGRYPPVSHSGPERLYRAVEGGRARREAERQKSEAVHVTQPDGTGVPPKELAIERDPDDEPWGGT